MSVVNRLSELHYLLYVEEYDLLLITENWLHDGIDTGLLDLEGMFHVPVLRKDRLHSRGGGVSVFGRRNINIAQVIFTDSYSILELVGFDLLCGKTKLRFLSSTGHPTVTIWLSNMLIY